MQSVGATGGHCGVPARLVKSGWVGSTYFCISTGEGGAGAAAAERTPLRDNKLRRICYLLLLILILILSTYNTDNYCININITNCNTPSLRAYNKSIERVLKLHGTRIETLPHKTTLTIANHVELSSEYTIIRYKSPRAPEQGASGTG